MKISKKEKLLLVMLVALLLSVVYYQFIYVAQNEKIAALEVQKQEVKTRYDQIMETISTLEQRQQQIEIYNMNIKEESSVFYPKLVQENLILELDKLLTENFIEGNISFTQVSVAGVEAFNGAEATEAQGSLQALVDQYNGKLGSSTDTGEVVATSGTTVEQLKVSLSFNSTYGALELFLSALEQYERQIVVTNLSVTPGLNDSVSGSMNLEFYAFPKFNGVDEQYLQWQLSNTYGKETPFSGIGASVGFNTIEDLGQEVVASNDFVILVKSTTSELPTFMMGIANDTTKATYITSDNEEIEDVTLSLTQTGDQYFYKYSNSTESYPISTQGLSFVPNETIEVEITSESRITADDLSGIKFTVVNETDKQVNVTVKNDDTTNPRVAVVGQGKVNVSQK